MPAKPIHELTIRELGQMVANLQGLPTTSKKYKDINERLAMASMVLEDSGALARLLWWCPEPRPDARAKLFVMPTP
jgi:hypothetical protein